MKTTHIKLHWLLVGLTLLFFNMQAHALMLTPADADATTAYNSNIGTLSAINTHFGTSYTDLELLWKGETDSPPAGQDGTLEASYLWNVDSPANGGTIAYVPGETAANCPTCVLIVKSGRHEPAQYLFDLGSWDGMESIELLEFWPDKEDAISNVAIWGGDATDVSEPGPLTLLALGLFSLVYNRKRKNG
jgi:hypothetical protein